MAETNQAPTTDRAVTTDQPAAENGLGPDPGSRPGAGLGWRARLTAALADAARVAADHAPDAAVGVATAIVVTAIGWLVAAALTLTVWALAAPANGSYAAPLHIAGQLWLAAHHVLLQTPDGPFGLSPLGFTILPVGSLVLAGRYAARHFNAGIWSFAAVAACYPLTALTIAWSAAAGSLHAELGAAAGYPCLIACVGFGAGLLSVRTLHLDRWAATAVRAGAAALAVLVVGAALRRHARGLPALLGHRPGRQRDRPGRGRGLRAVPDRPGPRAQPRGLGARLRRRSRLRRRRGLLDLSGRIDARRAPRAAADAGGAAQRHAHALVLPRLRDPAGRRSRRGADHRMVAAQPGRPCRGARRGRSGGRRDRRSRSRAFRRPGRRRADVGGRAGAVAGRAGRARRVGFRGGLRIRALVRHRLRPRLHRRAAQARVTAT